MKRFRHFVYLFVLLLAVSSAALGQITASPSTVTITGQSLGGAVTQRLSLSASPAVAFTIIPNPPVGWLSINPVQGATPAQVELTANPATLGQGAYSTSLQIFVGGNRVLEVPVQFLVGPLGASPASLSFAYQAGGTVPSAQTVSVTSFNPVSYTVTATTASGGNWLQVAPASGTTPGNVTVALNPSVVPELATGTYNGTVAITSPTGIGFGVSVTLTVSATAQVTAAPNALTFGFQIGGTNNTVQQTITLSTNSALPLNYGINTQVDPNPAGINWLSVSPTGGVIGANGTVSIAVLVNPATLPQGSYNGKLILFVPGASPANQEFAVRLNVSPLPLLNVPSATLTFNYQVGTAAPAAQTVTPTSTSTTLPYTIAAATNNGGNWLIVPTSGTTPAPFTVSVNPAGLGPGTYTGTVTVTGVGSGNGAQQIPVTLRVSNDPVIVPSSTALSFAYQVGQSAPPAQSVRVTTSTGAALNYTVTAQPSWLVLGGQTSGATDGTFTVQANVAGQNPGTYDGTVTVAAVNPTTGAAAPNSPVSIPVKFYVSTSPLILSSPGSLSFAAQVGGSSPNPQSITLSSTSPTEQLGFTVQFSTETGGNWLVIPTLQSGSTPNTLTVFAVPSLLSAGTYTGTIRISATTAGGVAAGNSPLVIPVTLTMTQGTLSVSPNALSFTQTAGGAAPAAQALTISATGNPANYTVATTQGNIGVTWLSVSANSGTTPGTVNVSVDAARLTPGTYQGQITVTAPGLAGSPAFIPVTFTVTAGTIAATPASLTFTAVQGGPAPTSQNINVTSGTGGVLNYTVGTTTQTGAGWLSANAAAGTTPGTIGISVNTTGLLAGSYTGTVTVTSPGATGSPLSIPVTLTVNAPVTLTVSATTLNFTYTSGLAVPPAQTFQVTSPGAAPVNIATRMNTGSGWLTATPATGSTPLTVSVAVTPQSLAAGNYTGTVTVSSPNSTATHTVNINLTVLAIPPPVATTVVNAASYVAGAVAPGEFIIIGGTGLGPAEVQVAGPDGSGVYPTTFSDTQVLFDNVAAPIYYVSAAQTSVIVPYNVTGRFSTSMVVVYKGVRSEAIQLRVADSAPGIFTVNQQGTGPGVIQNQDYSLNTAGNRAAKGSVLIVYATGEGQTNPGGVNGAVIPADPTRVKRPLLPVTATIGGRTARVQYAGSVGGLVSGVLQVNVEVPADAPSGPDVPISITVGSANSQPNVSVAIQ